MLKQISKFVVAAVSVSLPSVALLSMALMSMALMSMALLSVSDANANEIRKETSEQRRERLRIAVQAICPVSGDSLTDHATPVKSVNPETKEVLYVCCEGCVDSKPNEEHLKKIRANFVKAQGHCLVMADNKVSEKSKHSIIEGHAVFICCPPCTKKMNASPEKFLKQLDDLYEASLGK